MLLLTTHLFNNFIKFKNYMLRQSATFCQMDQDDLIPYQSFDFAKQMSQQILEFCPNVTPIQQLIAFQTTKGKILALFVVSKTGQLQKASLNCCLNQMLGNYQIESGSIHPQNVQNVQRDLDEQFKKFQSRPYVKTIIVTVTTTLQPHSKVIHLTHTNYFQDIKQLLHIFTKPTSGCHSAYFRKELIEEFSILTKINDNFLRTLSTSLEELSQSSNSPPIDYQSFKQYYKKWSYYMQMIAPIINQYQINPSEGLSELHELQPIAELFLAVNQSIQAQDLAFLERCCSGSKKLADYKSKQMLKVFSEHSKDIENRIRNLHSSVRIAARTYPIFKQTNSPTQMPAITIFKSFLLSFEIWMNEANAKFTCCLVIIQMERYLDRPLPYSAQGAKFLTHNIPMCLKAISTPFLLVGLPRGVLQKLPSILLKYSQIISLDGQSSQWSTQVEQAIAKIMLSTHNVLTGRYKISLEPERDNLNGLSFQGLHILLE